MVKVLVTGGAGFIGSHIVDALVDERYTVVVVDKANLKYSNAAAVYKINIANLKKVVQIFADIKPDYVIHCAALARIQPSLHNPIETYQVNVLGTLNILEAARRSGVKKVIYSASSSAYGSNTKMPLKENMKPRPLNPYAYSKLMAEMLIGQYVKNFDLKACSLRYFNVFGPRQPEQSQYATVIGIFLRQLKNSEPLTIVPDGNQRRDFTWVGDVVRANILAMKSEKVGNGEVINIGAGKNYSIFEVADIVGGRDYPRVFIAPRVGEARVTLADISKAKKLLDWEPKISLEEGIKILKEQIEE